MHILPDAASSFAGKLDGLFVLVTVLIGIGFVAAEGLLLYSAFRFRGRPGDGRRAAFIDGAGWRQARWVLLPVTVVVGGDLYIDWRTHDVWNEVKVDLPASDVHVRVTAQRFAWVIEYPGADGAFDTPDDVRTMNEWHVPVGKKVAFDLRSKDVLHSLFIPALRLKQDAVPGRTIRGWFEATTPGDFFISCAEICGTGHSQMSARLLVQSEADYAAWLAGGGASPATGPLDGATVAKAKGCLACHSTDGSKSIGPSWKGLWGTDVAVVTAGAERTVKVDEAYVRTAILEATADVVKGYQPLMPNMKGMVSDAEVDAIIAYLKTLR